MRRGLRQLFSVYPGGLPGAGLFLLRVVVGVVLVLFPVRDDWVTPIGGALLLAGFLTPFAALVAAVALAATLYGSPSHSVDRSLILLTAGCIALALLGPGSWSADARLFGRREIVIPRRGP